MATITLEYNARNSTASRIIDVIRAMDRVFKVKTPVRTNSILTRKAIEDVENGNVITCESYDDYLKHTAQYA
jgi:septum formation inhibitor-activating ATPase MinD